MLTIYPGLMVWTLITFAIAVFVLVKFAFGPIQKLLEDRRQQVQDSLDTAEQTRAEALRLLEDYKATLAKVRGEADEIVARARRTGEHSKAEILAEAHAQAERLVAKAQDQIERDTRAALRDLKSQVAELTVRATEKVTSRGLTTEDHERLIDEALAELRIDELGMELES